MHIEPNNPKLLAMGWVVCCACIASVGCQRRAYTDLYAESMASEIRELEDRIYEYDAAYQGIEEELAILQSENDRLHDSLASVQSESSRSPANSRSLFKNLPGARATSPNSVDSHKFLESYPAESEPSFQIVPKPDPVPNVVPVVPSKPSTNSKTPSVDKLPAPAESKSSKSPSPKTKSKSETEKLEPPSYDLGTPSKSILPPAGLINPSTPPLQTPGIESLQPPPLNTPPTPAPLNDSFTTPPNTSTQHLPREKRSVQSGALAHSMANQALPDAIDDDAMNAGKIELPSSIQPAAFQQSTTPSARAISQDTKVIEIAFHPTLCRGQYLGSKNGDDGLHLVLQPRNASGEPVDIAASITVVALDPNLPESQSKIGRWSLTKEEVDAKLEPIGISHGYHVPLQWQEVKPTGDSVQVYVRYEMEDGRRLVNERRIQLHVPTTGSASWTPRVAK